MPAPYDALAEVKMLELAGHREDEAPARLKHVTSRNSLKNKNDDIAGHRQTILEIMLMADKMAMLIQEIRNTNVETNDCLRKMEADLSLIASEG